MKRLMVEMMSVWPETSERVEGRYFSTLWILLDVGVEGRGLGVPW